MRGVIASLCYSSAHTPRARCKARGSTGRGMTFAAPSEPAPRSEEPMCQGMMIDSTYTTYGMVGGIKCTGAEKPDAATCDSDRACVGSGASGIVFRAGHMVRACAFDDPCCIYMAIVRVYVCVCARVCV